MGDRYVRSDINKISIGISIRDMGYRYGISCHSGLLVSASTGERAKLGASFYTQHDLSPSLSFTGLLVFVFAQVLPAAASLTTESGSLPQFTSKVLVLPS